MSLTVLVLEDDLPLLDLLRLAIEGWGHEVLSAAAPGEALRRARDAARIDVVLVDVGLLRSSGRDLVGELRAAHPGLRPVYMSGHARNHATVAPVPDGSEFLQKPFALADLEAALRPT